MTSGPRDESASKDLSVSQIPADLNTNSTVISASDKWKKLLGLLFSIGILVALYSQIDLAGVGKALTHADVFWLCVSIGMTVPITLLFALRFFWIAPRNALPSYWEALRLLLVANVLNLFLPAKLGDLTKSYFISKSSQTAGGLAVSLVVFERVCDLFGLSSWCLVGSPVHWSTFEAFSWSALVVILGLWILTGSLIASRRTAAMALALLVWTLPKRLVRPVDSFRQGWLVLHDELGWQKGWIELFSVGLWLLVLCQMWMFTLAVRAPVPFWICLALSALARFAGQMPYAFAGMGVRDVAFIVLFRAYMNAEAAAVLGVLTTVRAILPALVALLVVRPYLFSVLDQLFQRRQPPVAPG